MAQGTCSIDGCGKQGRLHRGWCSMHYARWQRHGDPLITRPQVRLTRCSVDGCERGGQMTRGFCRFHYYRWKQHGDPLLGRTNLSRSTVLRLLHEAARATTDECIVTLPHGVNERPLVSLDGRTTTASRAVWAIAHGDPGEALVLHRCNGGSGSNGCINIRHLYLGDHAQNVQDKIAAGRHRGWRLTTRSPE